MYIGRSAFKDAPDPFAGVLWWRPASESSYSGARLPIDPLPAKWATRHLLANRVRMTAPRNKKFEWQERMLEAKTLSYTERFIAFVLATKANGVGQEAFMSNREIEERTGASLKTVERARKKLAEEGWVKVTRRGGRSGDGKAWATTYVLAFPERRSAGWGAAAQATAPKAPVEKKTDDPASETHLGWKLPPTPQPDKATSQPDISWPQPDTGDGPLDQYSLDSGL